MDFDDDILCPSSNSKELRQGLAQKVLDRVAAQHPIFGRSDARMTPGFIKCVDEELSKIIDSSCELPRNDVPKLSHRQVQEVFKRMPDEIMTQPLRLDTILLLMDRIDRVMYEGFIENLEDHECDEAVDFNNRANARLAAGRYNEALADYNRACDMEPCLLGLFLNRARLHLRMGNSKGAIEDASYAFERFEGAAVEALWHGSGAADVFHQCGEHVRALSCIVYFAQAFKSLLPFSVAGRTSKCPSVRTIEYGGSSLEISSRLRELGTCIDIVRQIEALDRPEPCIGSLIEIAKAEILALRCLGGF